MSVNYNLGKKEISLNEEESIIINASEEGGYETREVKFKIKNEEIYVGAYCPNDGIDNYGTVLFNNRFIVILTRNRRDGITIVNTVFDMQSKKERVVLKNGLNEKYRNRFMKKYNNQDNEKTMFNKMKQYIPKELLPSASNSSTLKYINPPKGSISSKDAYRLQCNIDNQLQSSSTSPIVGHQKIKKL